MNKCYKCGREFEGQFCPDCETKYEAEKTCPDCGATLDVGANFCNNCGHRFTENVPSPKAHKENNFVKKVETFFVNTFNSTKTWIVNHKKQSIGILAGTASLALVCVLVFALIIPLATNIYSARKLSKINLGDSQEQVVKIIGEPYDKSKGYKWEYFGDELLSLIKEQEELDKKAENITSESQFEKLAKQQEELDKKFEKTKGKHIEVLFSGQDAVVSEVRYDAVYQITDASLSQPTVTAAKKEPKLITVDDKNVLNVEHIQESKIPVRVEYTDGSFSMAALPYNAEKTFGDIVGDSIFPSSVTLSWSDRWGTYSQAVNVDVKSYDFRWSFGSSTLNLQGNIPNKEITDFFQTTQLPWSGKKIDKVEIDDEPIAKSEWYKNQPDGLIYFYDLLLGYKGEIPENFEMKIKDGTTIVVSGAFYKCSNIVNVIIPDSVTSIGKSAFEMCSSLENITIGKNVISIGSSAFHRCSSLANINVASIESWCKIEGLSNLMRNGQSHLINKTFNLNGETITELVIPSTVTSIPSDAFREFENITSVTISDSVTSIQDHAFYYCSSITNMTIPDSVTAIGESAFDGCNKLQRNEYDNAFYLGNANNPYAVLTSAKRSTSSCIINENTKIIVNNAFLNCSKLTSITIPDSVTMIGNSAFSGCSSLTSATIGDSVTSIGYDAFSGCSSLASITIPDSVTSMNARAFCNCSSLTTVTISNNITMINQATFTGCSSLTSIKLSKSLKDIGIGTSAFEGCSSLTSVTIPDDITYIRSQSFYGCSSLTSVTIPSNVKIIEYGAFDGCIKLTTINFTGTVEQWNELMSNSSFSTFEPYEWNGVPATKVTCSDGEVEL